MRKGIALLLTLFFMMLIAVAVGMGLQTVNDSRKEIEKEQFMLQSSMFVQDVLSLLRNSPEIKAVLDDNTSTSLYALVTESSTIPLQSGEYQVLVSLKSARDRFNINELVDKKGKVNEKRFNALRDLLIGYGLQEELGWMFVDTLRGNREGEYFTDIFYTETELFREYMASWYHLETVLLYYKKKYHENVFAVLDFESLFCFERDRHAKIDLNYATPLTWQLLLGCTIERAMQLVQNEGTYESMEDLQLDEEEKRRLKNFRTSFFEPIVAVQMQIRKEDQSAIIAFEYDLKTQRAKNFVYEL